jgi:hypothetical protein
MVNFINRLLFVAVLLVGTSLACTINVGGPEPPSPPIPVSDEALQGLENTWQNAEVDPAAGVFAFTLNESQLTSAIAIHLQKQSDPLIYDPQIYLRDGQIILYGSLVRDLFTADTRIAITPIIDETGRLSLEIVSADFGPIPAPSETLESLSSLIDKLLTSSIAQIVASIQMEGLGSAINTDPSDYIIFESVQISNGMMTIAGRRR